MIQTSAGTRMSHFVPNTCCLLVTLASVRYSFIFITSENQSHVHVRLTNYLKYLNEL